MEEFVVNHSLITILPESIGRLWWLERFILNDNALTTLPESIGNLGSLVTIALENNPLERLPDSFGSLTRLKTVSMNRKHCDLLLGFPQWWKGHSFCYTIAGRGSDADTADQRGGWEGEWIWRDNRYQYVF